MHLAHIDQHWTPTRAAGDVKFQWLQRQHAITQDKRGDQVQHAMFDNLPITNNDDVLQTEVQTEISVEN